jgi:cytochrome-b5 reductase
MYPNATAVALTPCCCLLQEDKTKLKLLYANRTPPDILLRSQLRELQRQHPEQLEIRYLVEQPQPQGNGSVEGEQDETEDVLGVGRPCAEAIRGFLPRPLDARTAVLVCGPEGMMEALCGGGMGAGVGMGAGAPPRLGGLLRSMGYGRQVVQFSDTNSL